MAAIRTGAASLRLLATLGCPWILMLWPFGSESISSWQLVSLWRLIAAAASAYMRERAVGTYLLDDTVVIRLVVGQGSGTAATAWGCDLSDQYVRINAWPHHPECAVDRDLVIHQRLAIPAAELQWRFTRSSEAGRAERQQVGNNC